MKTKQKQSIGNFEALKHILYTLSKCVFNVNNRTVFNMLTVVLYY